MGSSGTVRTVMGVGSTQDFWVPGYQGQSHLGFLLSLLPPFT